MKLRQGFVSNSSSASFICPLCNDLFYIMDGDIDSEAHYTRCDNNHAFCMDHIDIEFLKQRAKDLINKNPAYKVFESKIDQVKSWDEIFEMWNNEHNNEPDETKNEGVYEFIFSMSGVMPSEVCPFCKMDEIMGCDILDYLNINPSVKNLIINNIKSEFKTYNDFLKATEETRKKREESYRNGSW